MTSRERVYKTLKFEMPDRVPRDVWPLPAIGMFRASELQAVLERYTNDIVVPVDTTVSAVCASSTWGGDVDDVPMFNYGVSKHSQGTPYVVGTYVDEWGCPWEVAEDGVAGEVKHPPIADWRALQNYSPPWEVLAEANWHNVNRICESTERFVLTPWHAGNPFEKMQQLRGTEALFVDLAYGSAEIFRLRDMVHEFFLREIELWCKTDVDGIRIYDDWGAQHALLISPAMWRELFKPLYVDYCELIHTAGKFVFMHSDGYITPIIPDLIEIGVDALNAQLFCMDIEELGRQHAGKITFWGEIDRQLVLPFGQPDDVREAVRRVRRALDTGQGGVIAQLEWGKNDPSENIEAAFEAWLE